MKTLLAMALAGLCWIAPAAAQSVGGTYSVEGTYLDGSPYSGTARITLTSTTSCVIEWQTGDGSYQGVCARKGQAFAAAYFHGESFTILAYQLQDDGSMEGLWTIAGRRGNGTEKLIPQR
jgi:hypothetical protein